VQNVEFRAGATLCSTFCTYTVQNVASTGRASSISTFCTSARSFPLNARS